MGSMRNSRGTFTFNNTGDMSQTTLTSTTKLGNVGDIRQDRFIMPYIKWTGTSPVGSAQLQLSPNNTDWANVGAAIPVSGNAGTFFWDEIDTGAHWLRVVYTKTSGTGTLTGGYSAKGF